jgi:hypothetical protein
VKIARESLENTLDPGDEPATLELEFRNAPGLAELDTVQCSRRAGEALPDAAGVDVEKTGNLRDGVAVAQQPRILSRSTVEKMPLVCFQWADVQVALLENILFPR